MAVNYLALAKKAAKLLNANGRKGCSISRPDASVSDPTKPWKRDVALTDIAIATNVVVIIDHMEQRRGSGRAPLALTAGTTALGYISPEVTGILPGDLLVVGNETFVILKANPIKPGDTLLLTELHLAS